MVSGAPEITSGLLRSKHPGKPLPEMEDIEYTIEQGTLFLPKPVPVSALVRHDRQIAVDMVTVEGRITEKGAVRSRQMT